MSGVSIFYTSDLHIGHEFVAKLRGFDTTDEHDETLVEKWNSTVVSDKHSVVYVLGDLTLRNPKRVVDFVNRLNGRKVLIYGNHDAGHPMHRGWQGKQAVYADMFEAAAPFTRRNISGQWNVMLSHFPYWTDHTVAARYMQWRLRDEGDWLLHGHTHSDQRMGLHPREIHVGLDAWGLTPVSEAEVILLLQKFAGGRVPVE